MTSSRDVQPVFKEDWRVASIRSIRIWSPPAFAESIYVAFGAVIMVLLIASANIANLLLAKAWHAGRRWPFGAALGASRGRLIAQVLTERLVLCLLGGLAGVGLAYLLIYSAVPLMGLSLPSTAAVTLDRRVLGFAAAAAVGVSLLVGLLPSLQLSSGRLSPRLNLAARGSSSREGMRRTIVVAEVAVSFILICGAVLDVPEPAQASAGRRRRAHGQRDHDVSRSLARDIPGRRSRRPIHRAGSGAAAGDSRGGAGGGLDRCAAARRQAGRCGDGARDLRRASAPGSSGSIRTTSRRSTSRCSPAAASPPSDRAGAPRVAIVNEALAKASGRKFGLSDPAQIVGRIVRLANPDVRESRTDRDGRGRRDHRHDPQRARAELEAPTPDVVYVALLQAPRREIKLIVRTRNEPAAAMPSIREAVRQIDPRLPLGDVRTMAQVKELTLSPKTQPAWIIGAFAGIAALLASLGLYGVLAHAVNQGRREIGIRMALGAGAADVLSRVLRSAAWMVLIGLAIGLAGALALTRVMKSLLFEVSALDPLAFTLAAVSMALVGLFAALVPASRASRVDPVTALRSEA